MPELPLEFPGCDGCRMHVISESRGSEFSVAGVKKFARHLSDYHELGNAESMYDFLAYLIEASGRSIEGGENA